MYFSCNFLLAFISLKDTYLSWYFIHV